MLYLPCLRLAVSGGVGFGVWRGVVFIYWSGFLGYMDWVRRGRVNAVGYIGMEETKLKWLWGERNDLSKTYCIPKQINMWPIIKSIIYTYQMTVRWVASLTSRIGLLCHTSLFLKWQQAVVQIWPCDAEKLILCLYTSIYIRQSSFRLLALSSPSFLIFYAITTFFFFRLSPDE